MIPLEQLPDSTVLQILQKLELRTWFLSRTTGTFIFDFVQENGRRFNFSCPMVELRFRFGNLNSGHDIALGHISDYRRIGNYVGITDPTVSLVGLRFKTIFFREFLEMENTEGEEIVDAVNKRYLLNRSNILNSIVLPFANFLKHRTQRVLMEVSEENIGLLLEATGCRNLFLNNKEWGFNECQKWIDEPQCQVLRGLKLPSVSHFYDSPQLIRRFEYFKAVASSSAFVDADCQPEIREVLQNLVTGPPLLEPRSVVLKRGGSRVPPRDGKELEAVNHRIIFNKKIRFFDRHSEGFEIFDLLVALVEETNFVGVIAIFLDYTVSQVASFCATYRMELFPSLDPEKIALFLLQRTVPIHPVDVSGLFEDLKSGEDVANVISNFLTTCHAKKRLIH